MTAPTQEELVRIAHEFYPRGFPPEQDDPGEDVPAYQRTPEHQRFIAAWEQALAWPAWSMFMAELRRAFPNDTVGGGTQPFVSACLRCQLYREEPLPDGTQLIRRLAVAVSVLSPLYVVYETTQLGHADRSVSRPELTFELSPTLEPQATALVELLERVLGCRPFPLRLARTPLPGIRVGQLNYLSYEPPPTLLDAFFIDDLGNLP